MSRSISTCLVALLSVSGARADDRFIPLDDFIICGEGLPAEAEMLAVAQFNRAVARFTGRPLPLSRGTSIQGRSCLWVGNANSLAARFRNVDWASNPGSADDDGLNQSYVLGEIAGDTSSATLIAAGLGRSRDPRAYLGLGYALGDFLRRMDLSEGRWGVRLSAPAQVFKPEMPNRTLYLMNSANCSPGLSLEYFDREQIEDYVDFLVEARYSRINLWQWHSIYLYPGNAEERRPANETIHRAMRCLFDRARRRGLQVYQGLTPVHVNPAFLPKDPKYTGTGYYGASGICWSQPEGRELARKMAQTEMEYYGPVDGYIVWFYDPGGCFCTECKANQDRNIFEQLTMVEDLSRTISPGAAFQAVLWPTWCWHEYQDRGIPYTREEVETMVKRFLARCLEHFGPRGLTIYDSCEADNTNIYNGWVDPAAFRRSAFMYSVLGMASEHAYPFAPFRFTYLNEKMGLARDRKLEDGNLFIQYAATNRPGVFAFADTLFGPTAPADERIERYVSSIAKGDARPPAIALFTALEKSGAIGPYEERDAAIAESEAALKRVESSAGYFGDLDWVRGYVKAQRYYLDLARAADQQAFDQTLARFKADVGAIPMYRDFMTRALTPELAVNLHLKAYWRGPGQDYRMVGQPPR